jgi:DNA (cytosine-5)-methyltransferase 1
MTNMDWLVTGDQTKVVRLPSGIIVSESLAEDYYRQSQKPIAVDLFAGCGGFSCGLMMAGFEVVGAVENDAAAAMTYLHNLGGYPMQIHRLTDEDERRLEKVILREWKRKGKGTIERASTTGDGWIKHERERGNYIKGCQHFFFGDARLLTGKMMLDIMGLKKGEIDLVVGGPPCQGFSFSGKRQVMDPRNSLVFEFARLVCELQPKSFCMENVPGIISMVTPDGLSVMDALAQIFEEGGMGTYDSIKRFLGSQPNLKGVMKHKKREGKELEEQAQEVQQQVGLFD